jgi:uncharacterized protein YlaI
MSKTFTKAQYDRFKAESLLRYQCTECDERFATDTEAAACHPFIGGVVLWPEGELIS